MKVLGRRSKPSEPERQAWRLETFDLRAGLAFATYRESQSSNEQGTQGLADSPCLFFAPPAFEPQPVDNVGLALAASRGSFDSGFIVDGEEVGFGSPAEIAEFMRRAYVASASGDGSDAPGGGGQLCRRILKGRTGQTDRHSSAKVSRSGLTGQSSSVKVSFWRLKSLPHSSCSMPCTISWNIAKESKALGARRQEHSLRFGV